MTELFESALEARNIKFVKTFEDDENIDYLIQGYSLEGIIVIYKEMKETKLYIKIPHTSLHVFSSHRMQFKDSFKNHFGDILDNFLDIIQNYSNRFNRYLENQPTTI
jgi:hypothetical protein